PDHPARNDPWGPRPRRRAASDRAGGAGARSRTTRTSPRGRRPARSSRRSPSRRPARGASAATRRPERSLRAATTRAAWYMKPSVLTTRFTELVGCCVPLQQAGMGTSDPELAVAVARAGGLGMVSGVLLPPARLAETLDAISIPTGGSIGANFLIPFLED